MPAFDPQAFKKQFPLFAAEENLQLIYLDNAATTQRPQPVIDAIARFYATTNANTHRSSHRLARRATAMVETTRAKAAAFVGATGPEEIVFTRGATEALNLLAHSLGAKLQPGDEVLLSTAEHHANLVPWQMLAQRQQLVLRFVPEEQGLPRFDQLTQCLNERTRVVSLTAGSNALGFAPDMEIIRAQLVPWRQQLTFILDAAQLAAHQPLDVKQLDCDFLVCSAHKFYGPTGIGLLYGRSRALAELPPWLGGGEMIEQVQLESSTYAAPPHRFETGTSALAAIAGLDAAFDFLQRLDRAAMVAYETALTTYLHQQLGTVTGINLLTRSANNLGIAALVPDERSGLTPTDLAHLLDEKDIAVRVGHHCAQPLLRSLEMAATVRVSIAAYNTRDDIDCLTAALREILDGCGFLQPAVPVVCAEPESGADTDVFAADVDALSSLSLEHLKQAKGWQARYRQLMKWGDVISAKPAIRQPANLVPGCESAAWLIHSQKGGTHRFAIDSESRVVKGLAALLLVLIDGRRRDQVELVRLETTFAELGLDKHLSPSRSNGFRALLNKALNCIQG